MTTSTAITVTLQRMDDQHQARLSELMEKNNEGTITTDERVELEKLVAWYEEIMLANSEILLAAARPDLVDATGRIDPKRLAKAVRLAVRPAGKVG
jgi:hypothetical protein